MSARREHYIVLMTQLRSVRKVRLRWAPSSRSARGTHRTLVRTALYKQLSAGAIALSQKRDSDVLLNASTEYAPERYGSRINRGRMIVERWPSYIENPTRPHLARLTSRT